MTNQDFSQLEDYTDCYYDELTEDEFDQYQKIQKKRQDDWDIHTYADFAERCDGLILCNAMQDRFDDTIVSLYSGKPFPSQEAEANKEPCEVFQWYIMEHPYFATHHTTEMVFYDEELDLYLLGVSHVGTAWSLCPPPELK